MKSSLRGSFPEGPPSNFYPGSLLGHLDASNKFPISADSIVSWTDDKIVLKFPRGYAKGIFDLAIQRARDLKVELKESDIEVQYQVRTVNEEQSPWFP